MNYFDNVDYFSSRERLEVYSTNEAVQFILDYAYNEDKVNEIRKINNKEFYTSLSIEIVKTIGLD